MNRQTIARVLRRADRLPPGALEYAITKHVGPDEPEVYYSIAKADDEKRFTLGPVYIPGWLDAHKEYAKADKLQQALWKYVRTGDRRIRLQHKRETVGGEWVELMTWPFPVKAEVKLPNGLTKTVEFPADTPFMGVIWDEKAWPLVKRGDITGYSIGGLARRGQPMEVETSEVTIEKFNDKHDLLGRFAHKGGAGIAGRTSLAPGGETKQLEGEMSGESIGKVEPLGKKSTNKVWKGYLEDGTKVSIKCKSGMKDQEDAVDEMHQEVAAQTVNDFVGLVDTARVTIRPTVKGIQGLEDQTGPVQVTEFVKSQQAWDNPGKTGTGFENINPASLHSVALFDSIIGNVDRHAGNVLVANDGRIIAFDHGRAFPDVTEPIAAMVPEGRPSLTVTEYMSSSHPEHMTLSAVDRGKLVAMKMYRPTITRELEKVGKSSASVDEMYKRVDHMLKTGKVLGPEDFRTRPWETS